MIPFNSTYCATTPSIEIFKDSVTPLPQIDGALPLDFQAAVFTHNSNSQIQWKVLNVITFVGTSMDAHRGGGVRGEGGMKQNPPGKFSKNLLIKMQ